MDPPPTYLTPFLPASRPPSVPVPTDTMERKFASGVMVPLIIALAELHVKGIIHRDVRPESVYFTRSGTVVLGGLSNAVERKIERAVSQVGRVDFMAPEMLTKPTLTQLFHRVVDEGISEDELPCYGDKVDIWSLGVCFLYLLTGCNPFAPTMEELTHRDILYSQSIESKQQTDIQGQWANRVLRQQLQISEDLAKCQAQGTPEAPAPGAGAKLTELWSADTGGKNAAVTAQNYIFGDVLSMRQRNMSSKGHDVSARLPGTGEADVAEAPSDAPPTDAVNPAILSELSPGFLDLLSKMFVFDPSKRASAYDLLCHPYIKEIVGSLCKHDVRSRMQTLIEVAPAAAADLALEPLTADSFARERRTSGSKMRRSSIENRYKQYQHA